MELSREIILLTTSNCSFYKTDTTVKQLQELKTNFSHFTSHMFQGMGNYVVGPQAIIDKFNEKLDDNNQSRRDEDFQHPVRDKDFPRSITAPVPPVSVTTTFGPSSRPTAFSEYVTNVHPPSQQSEYDLFPPTEPGFSKNSNFSPKFRVSNSGQSLASSWVEDVKTSELRSISTNHHDIVLCAAIIKGTYIATGGKDSLINVYTFEGEKIATLRAHASSICTIGVLNPFDSRPIMMSGGDLGCNTVVFWDTNTWTVRSKVQAHSAAVTSLLDLADGQTMVSGSFDKKINIINYNRSEVMYNMPVNKHSVTGIVLNANKNKMVSAGITDSQSSLSVWNISRRAEVTKRVFRVEWLR